MRLDGHVASMGEMKNVYSILIVSTIAGSNSAWGLDVCPRVSVLCCPVSVEVLRRADPPAKESYQMSVYVDREAH
jgi:hypothetical protein